MGGTRRRLRFGISRTGTFYVHIHRSPKTHTGTQLNGKVATNPKKKKKKKKDAPFLQKTSSSLSRKTGKSLRRLPERNDPYRERRGCHNPIHGVVMLSKKKKKPCMVTSDHIMYMPLGNQSQVRSVPRKISKFATAPKSSIPALN